jgi:hypothetical protein
LRLKKEKKLNLTLKERQAVLAIKVPAFLRFFTIILCKIVFMNDGTYTISITVCSKTI